MSYSFADILQAVSKPVWHIPLLCVQWKTTDDGQRNCPKHVEFHSKNKFEKMVHLVGYIIRNLTDALSCLLKCGPRISSIWPPLIYNTNCLFQGVWGGKRVVYRVFVGKPEGKRPLGRPRRWWVDNIRMDLQEVGCGGKDWIELAQNRDRRRELVNAVMNLRVP